MFAADDLDAALQQHDVKRVFYALQNILSAAGNASKALWGQGGDAEVAARRKPLRDSIGISDDSPLQPVGMRNNFEHFDNRIDQWWEKSKNHNHVDMNIGGRDMIAGIDKLDWFRNYDSQTTDLSFWGDDFNVRALISEVQRILPKLREEAGKPHW